MSNSLNPDLDQYSVYHDLGLNSLQRWQSRWQKSKLASKERMVPTNLEYCGCSKISNTKVEANSTDPDQTASLEAVWSDSLLFAILASIRLKFQLCKPTFYLRKESIQNLQINCMSRDMRFPTMWYVQPAKPQISLRIRAVWSEAWLVA